MTPRSVEERMRALEDERAIVCTLGQYSRAIDHGADAAAFVECFTETAVWYITQDGAWAGGTSAPRLEGRQALRDWFDRAILSRRGSPDRALSKHVFTAPSIEIDGDRATVASYYFILTASEVGPTINSFGRLLDVFARCEDGRWRIQERRLSRESGLPERSEA